jgi:hypothetical protein
MSLLKVKLVEEPEIRSRETLDEVLEDVWKMLERGAKNRRDPFHTPVLASIHNSGEPSVRTVVFRKIISKERILICHSDFRSEKIKAIQKNPKISWLFYNPNERIQIRCNATASLHTSDALADSAWKNTQLMSRKCYLTKLAPGEPTQKPIWAIPNHLIEQSPTNEESEAGRANFAVISSKINSLDWLFLDSRGHRRALYKWENDKLDYQSWISP